MVLMTITTLAEKGLHRHTLRVLVAYLFSMLLKSIKLEPQHLQKKLKNKNPPDQHKQSSPTSHLHLQTKSC